MFLDFRLLLWTLPAVVLMMWAQYRLRSTYSAGMQIQTPLTGAAAAAHMLESAGVHDVGIEETPGQLSDHYDPSAKMLRLSPEVYRSRSATAVGIAAHEAGTLCNMRPATCRCRCGVSPPRLLSSAGPHFRS